MRDNQEMASILFNSNLATSDQLNENWGEITETRDIGQILVDKGILLAKVYDDLLQYIDSLHPENIVIEPDAETGEPSFDDLLDRASSSAIEVAPAVSHENVQDVFAEIPEEEIITPTRKTSSSTDNILDEDSFVVDLSDVAPHDETENPVQLSGGKNEFFKENIEMTREPGGGDVVREVVSQTVSTAAPAHSGAAGPTESSAADGDEEILPTLAAESRIPQNLTIAIPETISVNNSLDELLLYARANSISDLHLIPNTPITMRRFGTLHAMGEVLLSSDAIEEMLLSSLPAKEMEVFHEEGDAEFVYTIQGGGRFRVTVMKVRSGWSFTARIIPFNIAAFDEIGLSESAYGLTRWAQGLVLVTGPAGCGKSATLATLVETINSERNEHIITIEDPIETVFPLGKSQVTQRQVGRHTLSQENALRGALRQDPDILMVSELRDMESIQLAVSAAETGHLVFGTMNTTNAIRTINRLIESFPADEQDVIRSMVSESLRGVISQQLIPRKDGTGVVPAFEVLLVTPAVANMIRKNEMHQLGSAMVTGRGQGMILFDDSLMQLVKDNIITGDEAYSRANEKEQFESFRDKSGGN